MWLISSYHLNVIYHAPPSLLWFIPPLPNPYRVETVFNNAWFILQTREMFPNVFGYSLSSSLPLCGSSLSSGCDSPSFPTMVLTTPYPPSPPNPYVLTVYRQCSTMLGLSSKPGKCFLMYLDIVCISSSLPLCGLSLSSGCNIPCFSPWCKHIWKWSERRIATKKHSQGAYIFSTKKTQENLYCRFDMQLMLETGQFCLNVAILVPGGVLTYLAERGCAALMGRFFTRNP